MPLLAALAISSITALQVSLAGGILAFAFIDIVVPSDCLPWGQKRKHPADQQKATAWTLQHIGEQTTKEVIQNIRQSTGWEVSASAKFTNECPSLPNIVFMPFLMSSIIKVTCGAIFLYMFVYVRLPLASQMIRYRCCRA